MKKIVSLVLVLLMVFMLTSLSFACKSVCQNEWRVPQGYCDGKPNNHVPSSPCYSSSYDYYWLSCNLRDYDYYSWFDDESYDKDSKGQDKEESKTTLLSWWSDFFSVFHF